MPGHGSSQKNFSLISLRNGRLTSTHRQMTVCRRPNCDRAAAERGLGFCPEDHAAYVRSRERFASLASAAQVVHAGTFALVPKPQRQMLAEYLVAVASEELAAVSADIPRSAVLLAAALVARGRGEIRFFDRTAARRRRASSTACLPVAGRSR